MRTLILLMSVIATISLFGIHIYNVGEAPWNFEIYNAGDKTYALILDRGRSSLVILDLNTGGKKVIELPSFPTDIYVEDNEALITCIEKGALVKVNLSDFEIDESKLLGAQIFRFLRTWPVENGYAVLSYDGKVLVITKNLEVSKIFYTSSHSLDAALWRNFLVSLKSENYDPIWHKLTEEKAVVFSDLSTGKTFREYAGKIPAYILTLEKELLVISYWDGQITAFDENMDTKRTMFNARVNSPVIVGNTVYLLSFDTSELLAVDPETLKVVRRLKLKGRGPVKLKVFDDWLVVLNVLDDSVDVVDLTSFKNLFHFHTGRYPMDVEKISENKLAVLCEEAGQLWLHEIEK